MGWFGLPWWFMDEYKSGIVIEVERKIKIPQIPSFDEIEQRLSERIDQSMVNIRQEMNAEIGRSNDIMNRRIKLVEDRLAKSMSNASPAPAQTYDLTPIQKAITQIQAEQRSITLHLGQLESKVSSPRQTVANTDQTKIDGLNREIDNLRRVLTNLSQDLTSLKVERSKSNSQISQLTQENSELKQQVARQNQQIAIQDQRISRLEQLLSSLGNQNVATSPKPTFKIVSPIQKPIEKSTEKSIEKPIEKPWITSFEISEPRKPVAFFRGDAITIKNELSRSIQDLDSLITYVKQSQITDPARQSFIKNLGWCLDALSKLYDKFNFQKYDLDELSEEITNRFFKIIGEILLDNIMIGIYRGGKNSVGYEQFLQKLNQYLSNCGIYTHEILPGEMVEGDLLDDIDPPISKKTSIKSDDGKVGEVELLPYFMTYEDGDGDLDTFQKRGRIIILKYGE